MVHEVKILKKNKKVQEKETCKIQRMGICFPGYLKDKGRGGGETFRLVINPGGGKRCKNMQKLNKRKKFGGGGHTVLLHDAQELDDDLGRRPDQDLPLAGLLGVVDGIQSIVENGSLDHFDGD